MDEGSVVDLSRYRLEKAGEMLAAAYRDAKEGDFASAANRAYYCIFHAMRAVLALDREDYKKHSAVIARFTMQYLKPEILSREYGSLINNAALTRNRSDYEDFYTCSEQDAQRLIAGAERFLTDVTHYLNNRYDNE